MVKQGVKQGGETGDEERAAQGPGERRKQEERRHTAPPGQRCVTKQTARQDSTIAAKLPLCVLQGQTRKAPTRRTIHDI